MIIFIYSDAEEEKRKREEAERKAKLDAIAEKQRERERELEEKARKSREELLRGSQPARVAEAAPVAQLPREQPAAAPAAAAAAVAPTPGKYVPKFRAGSQRAADPRTREDDRWGAREERPRPDVRPLRQDAPPARHDAPPAARPDGPPPSTDRWRPSRLPSNSSSSSSTWGGRPRN